MTTNYSFDRPPSQPKPYRVSKFNQNHLVSQDGFNPIEVEAETKPTRAQTKKTTTIGLEKANYDLAIERANSQSNRYYKGKLVPITVDQEHFKIYGPGIYLFFAFIWKLSILFFILTLISLLPMIYNYLQGTKFSNSVNSFSVYISRLSVGNFYGDDSSLTYDEQMEFTRVPKLINCVSDLVSMFLVMLFYFYWTWKSDQITQDIKKTFKLPNYHTLELTAFHQDTSDYDVYRFFSQFGMVNQVAHVKNYSETIKLSKQIYECETEIKQLKMDYSQQQLSLNDKNTSFDPKTNNSTSSQSSFKHNQKLTKLQQKLRKLYKELYQEEKKSQQQTIKYYITFATPLQRTSTLKKFNQVYSSCCLSFKTIDEKFTLKGSPVEVSACHNQPGEIIWENVHITWWTRWMRALLQFIVLLFIVCLGFFVISAMDVITTPSTYQSIDTSSYTSSTILLESNLTIVQSWCLKNTAIATSTSTQLTDVCQPYITSYYINLAITYCITVFVILFKTLLKKIVIWIAKFQRYTEHTQQSIDVMKNLVIIYIITTVVIGFLLQADLFGIQFKNIVPDLVNNSTMKYNASYMNDYSVLQNTWYIDIGYQIWLTWLILSLSPHTYMPLFHYFIEWLNNKFAQTQKFQKTMDSILQPAEFQLQDHYANIIMIFFVGIIFSGGMPAMIMVSFVGIITRYCYLKFLFIRFSRVPKSIDEHLNIAVLSYIPWALGGHFSMTIWMYSVSSVFAFEDSIFSDWYNTTSSGFVQFISKGLEMIIASYYYTIVGLIIMLFIFVKQLVYDVFIRICRKGKDPIQISQMESTASQLVNNNKNAIIASQRGITNSYKIQNNPDYFEILSIKDKMKSKIDNGEFHSNKNQNI